MEHYYKTLKGHCTDSIYYFYKEMVKRFDNGSRFVELGAYKGQSTSVMAVEIINSGKDIKFDTIDTFRGSVEHLDPNDISADPILIEFGTMAREYAMGIAPVKHVVRTLMMESKQAVDFYNNESIDMMFVDASHEYENIKEDLTIWYPKIKVGGIFAGHDAEFPGPKKALQEFFTEYHLFYDCWFIEK